MILSGIKMHPQLPDCILASRLNDRCLGASQVGAQRYVRSCKKHACQLDAVS